MNTNSILKKLLYRGQDPVLILNAPQEFDTHWDGIVGRVDRSPNDIYGFILVCVENSSQIEALIPSALSSLADGGLFWVCYPKKSSKRFKSDISRDIGWEILGNRGFEPVTQVAIDEDWSALRFRMTGEIKTLTRKFALSAEGRERIAARGQRAAE